MNNLMVAVFAGLIAISSPQSLAEEPVKKYKTVCHDAKDRSGNLIKDKTGKVKQECKKIRVHKKYDGKKVPDKKNKQ